MGRSTEYDLALEQIWLQAFEDPALGLNQPKIAALVGRDQSVVSRRLARARANRSEMPLIFVGEACERHREMLVNQCMVCLHCGRSTVHENAGSEV